jgi:hypothetical protein
MELYPSAKLKHIRDVKHNLSANFKPSHYLNIQMDDSSHVKIICQKNISKGKTPGNVESYQSEYNDQTYDEVAITSVTAISIFK